jgi:glycerol-3-phosphate acyltransferase PlsY
MGPVTDLATAWSAIQGAAVAAVAYLFGGLSPGHWLVKRRTGTDVRGQGTGVTGATNVGRVLGPGALVLIVALDLAKGSAPVAAGRLLGLGDGWLGLVAFATVAGHIWPAHLGFRGGKGAAPACGAWLALDWRLVAIVPIAAACFVVLRRFTPSSLLAALFIPVVAWWFGATPVLVAWTAAMVALLWWAHRSNVRSLLLERGRP